MIVRLINLVKFNTQHSERTLFKTQYVQYLSLTIRSSRESVNPLTDFRIAKKRAAAGMAGVLISTTALAPPSGMSCRCEWDDN